LELVTESQPSVGVVSRLQYATQAGQFCASRDCRKKCRMAGRICNGPAHGNAYLHRGWP